MSNEIAIEFQNSIIRQNTENGFFCATDLVKLANKDRVLNDKPRFSLVQWLKGQQVQEFTQIIENKYGKAVITTTGRNGSTWLHPYLFFDLASAISPKYKIDIYEIIRDARGIV